MPERYVLVRWPGGARQRIYSPSTVVEEYFAAGQRWPVPDFVERGSEALRAASDRVREAYGFPCSRAARSIADIQRNASEYPEGEVHVEGIVA
jgi:uncharacterized repeat protein (TIGR04042 family)